MDGWRGTHFDTNWKDKTAVDWTDVLLDSEGMGHGGSTRNCYKFFEGGISNALDGSEDDALWQNEENVDEESESEEDYSSEEESNDV